MIKERALGEKWRRFTTIDGNHCPECNRVGYCWSETHRGYLTVALMKEHECIEKECRHFQKYERAPYWQNKEKRKAEKKAAQAKEKEERNQMQEALEKVRMLTSDDPDFFAVGITPNKWGYTIRYIRFAWLDIFDYVSRIRQELGVPVYLQEIKNTYDNKIAILKAQKLI